MQAWGTHFLQGAQRPVQVTIGRSNYQAEASQVESE